MIRWFRKERETPGAPAEEDYDDDLLRYPPAPKGIPVRSPERLLDDQADVIDRLRRAMPFSYTEFDVHLRPFLLTIAEWVHLLPASQDHHHRLVGGLLRHTLEVGWMATQFSNAQLFEPTAQPGVRREREPRWHVAAGLCGLSHDLGKVLTDLEVTDRSGGLSWNALEQSLVGWCRGNNLDRYFVRYRHGRTKEAHEIVASLMFTKLVPPELLAWLGRGGVDIVEAIAQTLSPGEADRHTLRRLVRRADRTSVEKDLQRSGQLLAAPGVGLPIHSYVITAMAGLLEDGVWTVNKPGSRVWILRVDGVTRMFIVWHQGHEEILARVDEERMPGVPRNAARILDLLTDTKIAEPYVDRYGEVHSLWPVAPPGLGGNRLIVLQCACIGATDLLFRNRAMPNAIDGGRVAPEDEGDAAAPAWDLATEGTPGSPPEVTRGGPPDQSPSLCPPAAERAVEEAEPPPLAENVAPPPAGAVAKPARGARHAAGDAPSPRQKETVRPPAVPISGQQRRSAGAGINADASSISIPPAAATPAEQPAPPQAPESGGASQGDPIVSQASVACAADQAAEEWGALGQALIGLIQDVKSGRIRRELLVREGDRMVLVYPQGAKACRRPDGTAYDPMEFLRLCETLDAIEVDPLNPLKRVQSVGQVRGVVLKGRLGAFLRAQTQGEPNVTANIGHPQAKTVVTNPAVLQGADQEIWQFLANFFQPDPSNSGRKILRQADLARIAGNYGKNYNQMKRMLAERTIKDRDQWVLEVSDE